MANSLTPRVDSENRASKRPVFFSDRPVRSERGGARVVDLTGKERHLRAAMHAMGLVGAGFARAARRTLPFLVRRRARLIPLPVSISDALSSVQVIKETTFEVRLEAEESSAWGRLTLNAGALALLLDGALGGDASNVGPLTTGLSLAQAALVTRIANSLAQDLCLAVEDQVDIRMKVVAARSLAVDDPVEIPETDGLTVECFFEGMLEEAVIQISLSAEALEAAAREQAHDEDPAAGDPRMAEALLDVPVEVMAVLGTLTLGLRHVLTLQVGQVLRLSTALDDAVEVRVGGIPKFAAVPVTSRGQLSVRIRGRHEE